MNTVGHTYEDNTQSVLFTFGILLLCSCAVMSLYWTQNAALLNYLFPFLAIIVGILLFASRPALYLGFSFWIWFVTPFIRRIVDYQMNEFTSVSLIMLTPYLVSAITIVSFFRFLLLLRRRLFLPYLLMMLGVMYGYVIGILKTGLFGATFNLMEWFVPLMVGFHVLLHWRTYPEHKSAIRSAFAGGVLFMGIYGMIQFVVPAPWDIFWMESAGMTSIGHPEPFRLRVFSTLNAPGPFAMTTMAGLILMFDGKGMMSKVAIVPGYISFLLATVRGAWGGWILAVLFAVLKMTGPMRARMIGLMIFGTIVIIPISMFGPDESVGKVGDRLGTFGNLEEDGSFNARMHMYQTRAITYIANPIGEGLGFVGGGSRNEEGSTRNLDSGILALFVSLGWLGTGLFVAGIYFMLSDIIRKRNWALDQFSILTTGVGVSYLALMVMANQLLSIKGIIVWVFLSLALASRKYYETAQYR